MDESKTFGDRQTFAIHYRPSNENDKISINDKFAFCHLIVDNNFIGYNNELCSLSTWVYYLTDMKNFIQQNKDKLFPKEFDGLTDREIFEAIMKSSQFEDEFYPDFLYLPSLDGQISYRHQFFLDETIDGYYFYYYIKDNKLIFLIEDCLGLGFQVRRSYNFIFSEIDLDNFFQTISDTVTFLVETYPYLADSISTRTFNSS